jgi:hypothetical protein
MESGEGVKLRGMTWGSRYRGDFVAFLA